jgi:hypothetical protein
MIKIKMTTEMKMVLKKLGDFKVQGIRAGMLNLVETIEAKAVKFVPVRTSNLLNSITSSVSPDGKKGLIKATAPYAKYVHEGTGLFGPFKMLIKPKTKKALFWEGAAHPYRSVKGQKPNRFFLKAIKDTDVSKEFGDGIMNYWRMHKA